MGNLPWRLAGAATKGQAKVMNTLDLGGGGTGISVGWPRAPSQAAAAPDMTLDGSDAREGGIAMAQTGVIVLLAAVVLGCAALSFHLRGAAVPRNLRLGHGAAGVLGFLGLFAAPGAPGMALALLAVALLLGAALAFARAGLGRQAGMVMLLHALLAGAGAASAMAWGL